jgi:protein O-mannosyl-transferase
MRRPLFIPAVVLLAAIAVSFAPLFRAGITNWDDEVYLRSASAPLSTLLTAPVMGNYHPLTMLSLALDQRLFGVRAVELHAMNVLLHAIASLAVLMLLLELCSDRLKPAATLALAGALFFAIHPLRVESVGWIAERKDVLCELFFAAALLAYVRHIRRGAHFGWVFVLFILAVLSKATAVVFPVATLLIDFLERRRPRVAQTAALFGVSAVAGIGAILVQRGSGALSALPGFAFSPLERALLACRALVMYIAREIVPVNLSAFYAYPKSVGMVDVACAAAVVALTIAVVAAAYRWRPLFFGLAFFLLTIAPTLPLLSIGRTMAADRYTLLPSIGLAYLVAVGVAALRRDAALAAIAAGAIVLSAATWQRCAVWRDSVTLWTSVIDYDDRIPLAYNSRAVARIAAGDAQRARVDLDRALILDRCHGAALRNRALLAGRAGDLAAADGDLQRAIRCDPRDALAWRMRCSLLEHAGRVEEARRCTAAAPVTRSVK